MSRCRWLRSPRSAGCPRRRPVTSFCMNLRTCWLQTPAIGSAWRYAARQVGLLRPCAWPDSGALADWREIAPAIRATLQAIPEPTESLPAEYYDDRLRRAGSGGSRPGSRCAHPSPGTVPESARIRSQVRRQRPCSAVGGVGKSTTRAPRGRLSARRRRVERQFQLRVDHQTCSGSRSSAAAAARQASALIGRSPAARSAHIIDSDNLHLRRRSGRHRRRPGAHRRGARSEPGREHHPRLPFGVGSVAALGRRARPPDHARRAGSRRRLPHAPRRAGRQRRHRPHGARRDQCSAPPGRRR